MKCLQSFNKNQIIGFSEDGNFLFAAADIFNIWNLLQNRKVCVFDFIRIPGINKSYKLAKSLINGAIYITY